MCTLNYKNKLQGYILFMLNVDTLVTQSIHDKNNFQQMQQQRHFNMYYFV